MKRFIQLFSLLGLALAFTAASANAQRHTVDAKIPFNFSVADKSYEAGNYKLNIQNTASGGAVITLTDTKGNNLQSFIADRTGNTSKERAELVFEGEEGAKQLSQISLTDRGYTIASPKANRPTITRNKNNDSQPASVSKAS